ncbi:MAG: mechanosensitive ion channel [Phycisphaerae bacterium]|nr:mechanosensitive ion channel [Phycisphaerae bacterium]
MERRRSRTLVIVGICLLIAVVGLGIDYAVSGLPRLGGEGGKLSWPGLIGVMAGVLATSGLLSLATGFVLMRRGRPAVEGQMVGRLYWLVGFVALLVSIAYGFGVLGTFATAFSLFGGMLLGWSLQAPVSGFAAWILVSLKRPFRPGDRVQFPTLGLTGDIKDIGPMYTVLNQVGGSIASEEAVGRYILVPNAMLFHQVVINYTVTQEAAYMLDEVVVRITYDSDWRKAEQVLLEAARMVTADVIEATNTTPYIRADNYDYGVYLRLRYRTRVKDRAETSYKINKQIFEEIQKTPTIDIAIPYVYSFRAGQDRKDESARDREEAGTAMEIDVAKIDNLRGPFDENDVEQLSHSIRNEGLLQPVVVMKKAHSDRYEVLAGHMRLEACKKLGWQKIPAIVRELPAPLPIHRQT